MRRGIDRSAGVIVMLHPRYVLALIVLVACGCGGKPKELLHAVKGRITFDGQPLPRGSVTLRPESTQTTWHQPTGVVEPAGEYVIYTNGRPGAPPGAYRVIVFATEAAVNTDGSARPGLPKSLIPLRYNQFEQTSLRVDVVAQPTAKAYDLELVSHEKP